MKRRKGEKHTHKSIKPKIFNTSINHDQRILKCCIENYMYTTQLMVVEPTRVVELMNMWVPLNKGWNALDQRRLCTSPCKTYCKEYCHYPLPLSSPFIPLNLLTITTSNCMERIQSKKIIVNQFFG